MPPKKAQKMSLNEFLGNDTLGSWADEMDSLPTAPSGRPDEGHSRRGERSRDDFLSSKPDRGSAAPREDVPLPTEPPFTAFVGNLSFDVSEGDLEGFFAGSKPQNVKVIRDREERSKGFGYVEFQDLEGLKDAIAKSGQSLSGRTIRVSVAEPPKERSGFGGSSASEEASTWRRRFDGPSGGREREREAPAPSVAAEAADWRRGPRTEQPAQPEPTFVRRGSGFRQDGPSAAEGDEHWSASSKFKSPTPADASPRFGRRAELAADTPSPSDTSDWRSSRVTSRNSTSPNASTPPTPQMTRRKLELLPRTATNSAVPSPLSSPNPANANATSTATSPTPRSNPFGAAKPVDVSAKEAAVSERLEKERETRTVQQHSMSRTSSRTASHRGVPRDRDSAHPGSPSSPKQSSPKPLSPKLPTNNASVRPSFSFARAASSKKDGPTDVHEEATIDEVIEKVAEVEV